MGRLLKIEWLKIRKYRAFLILVGFFILSVFGINYIVYNNLGKAGPQVGMMLGSPFAFPEVWQTISYLSSYLLVISGLIIILLTANEYNFRTHRQSVINGLSRREFISSKIALIVILGLGLSLLVTVLSFLFAMGSPVSFAGIEYIGYLFLQAVLNMSIALAFVILFRCSGISIGIYLLYAFIVENLLALIINFKIFPGAGYYLPLKASSKLIPSPLNIEEMLGVDQPEPSHMLIATVIWIAVTLYFCIIRFQKKDL